jgi:hypothetical protein
MVRGGVHGDVGRTADGGRVAESRQKLDAPLPLTHVLTGFTAHWFDRNEISARFPQIAGFWILCPLTLLFRAA